MSTAAAVLVLLVSVAGVGLVAFLFLWAARKDGEEDRALQRKLGRRRRTRIGR